MKKLKLQAVSQYGTREEIEFQRDATRRRARDLIRYTR
jgi:hypothetical protein